MAVTFRQLHPIFVAEVTSSIDLRSLDDEATLDEIRAGMDRFGVLVFHNQPFTDEEQLAFAQRLDGQLNRNRVLTKSRIGNNDALVDISNLDDTGDSAGHPKPPPHVQPRQQALAHRRLLQRSARPLFYAARPRRP